MGGTLGATFVAARAIMMVCAFGATVAAQANRTVRGVITDVSDNPVPAARLQVAGKAVVIADDSGRFRVEVPRMDRVTFEVSRVGFMPTRFGLAEGGDTTVTILMLPIAHELPKVDVKATEVDPALDRSGFTQRLKEKEHGTNTGILITAAAIDRRHPRDISSMFEDLPNVTVCHKSTIETCGLWGTNVIANQRGRMVRCPITVYLDGQRLNSLGQTDIGVDIDTYILPTAVAGMEHYPSGNSDSGPIQLGQRCVWPCAYLDEARWLAT